jgi:hypothetical protein
MRFFGAVAAALIALHAPAWSPDGKRIAVYSLEDGSLNISVPKAP